MLQEYSRNDETNILQTETLRLQKIRTAQSQYRKNCLDLWDGKCAVTGIDNPSYLIAGHIKPWRESNNNEKIDSFNSVLLSPDYDKLFDKGIISFEPNSGKIILPEDSTLQEQLYVLGVKENDRLRFVPDKTIEYLEFHKRNIFGFTQQESFLDKSIDSPFFIPGVS